jgi:hypothetical protein
VNLACWGTRVLYVRFGSTADVAAKFRKLFFVRTRHPTSQLGRRKITLDIEPLNPDGFHAESTICQLPGLGVLRASSAAVHLTHSRDLIVDDDLSFMAAPTCPYEASQHGRNPVLGPATAC